LIIRIEVVFPQPDGPTSVVILPLGAEIVRLSTATVPSGYTLDTLSNVIMTVFLGRNYFGERLSRADTSAAAEASIWPYCTVSDAVSR
jgi:hypothetical protein